jgi:hypothetical protein
MAYIGNFPTSPGFSRAKFNQNTTTKTTTTQSGRSIRATNSTTLWTATLSFPTMSQAEFRPIQAFIVQAKGPLNEFDIVIPTVSESQSTVAASVVANVDGAHSVGDTAIAISTNQSAQTVLKAGDVVRFANHTKVYMATTDVNSDLSGNATLNIEPPLVENLVDLEGITTNNVPFRMILANDLQEFNYGTNNLVNYEIDVEEVL